MTPQTPPTDRPLTAGEALRRILPITVTETPDYAELTFGESRTQAMTMEPEVWLALNDLSRPATSAASEGETSWQATIDRIVPVIAPMDAIEASEFCCEHTLLLDRTRIRRELAALASPPVSERERELEGALQWGWRVRSKPSRFSHDRPWHWQADQPTGITAENCEYEPVFVTAQTVGEGK